MDGAREIYYANALLDCFDDCNIKDVECILQKDASVPNIILPGRGCTPFHLIVGQDDESFAEKVTKMFLKFGGNPNSRNDDGMTPVHVAAAWGKGKLLHLLLLNGGDPWLLDDEGNSAFNYAFEYKHWEIVDMLHRFRLMDLNHLWTLDQPKYKINLDKVMVLTGDNVLEYAGEKSQNLVLNVTETKDISRALPVYSLSNMFICSELSASSEAGSFDLEPSSNSFRVANSFSYVDYKMTKSVNENCANFKESEEYIRSIGGYEYSQPVKEAMNSKNNSVLNSTSLIKEKSMEMYQCLIKGNERNLSSYIHKTECVEPQSFLNQLSPPPADLYDSILTPLREMELVDKCNQSMSCVSKINDKQLYNIKQSNCTLNEIHCSFDSRDMFESTRNSNFKVSNILKDSLSDGIYKTCSDNSGNEQQLQVKQINLNKSSSSGNETFVSVIEEYVYSDEENGVVLIEQRHLVNKISVPIINEDEVESIKSLSSASSVSSCMSIPLCLDYDTDVLRDELRKSGVNPGPITTTTKRLYLRKLMKINKHPQPMLATIKRTRVYRPELEKTLKNMDWLNKLDAFMKLEQEIAIQFSNPDRSRRWRGGIAKTYFCYILLDPRITLNLPCRSKDLTPLEVWSTFLSAIFYVGKGVRSRPYAHLNESSKVWKNKNETTDGKVQHIIDIWSAGMGVICLHIFQNVISVEAHTREASMIEAIGLQNLKNARYSEYYGKAATWTCSQKAKLGVYLLYCALQIFLNEGERQLYPHNM